MRLWNHSIMLVSPSDLPKYQTSEAIQINYFPAVLKMQLIPQAPSCAQCPRVKQQRYRDYRMAKYGFSILSSYKA